MTRPYICYNFYQKTLFTIKDGFIRALWKFLINIEALSCRFYPYDVFLFLLLLFFVSAVITLIANFINTKLSITTKLVSKLFVLSQ